MGDTLSSEEIRKMVNNTADLQQKAAEALSSIANRQMKVFDPRNEADITSEDGAIVWSSKSIELAYDALKKGFGLRKSPFYRGNVDLRKANLTFQYTEEEIAEIIRCKKDIVYFANKYVYLKTPQGRRKIKLRPYQVKLLKTIQDNKYVCTLMARQCGKTTTTSILFVWYLCFHTDKTAAIVANKDSIAAEVFGKVQNIFEHLPFFLKPGAYTFSSTTISLDNGCKALYRTATIDTVQGFTIDMMFVDEFAYIKNTRAREFWVNAYPTMSSIPDSKVILCSTPNGRNLFWELWNGAITGKNMFIPFRVDYWQVPGRDDKWVAQEKANIGEEGFAQQYELSFDTKMKSILGKSTFQFLDKVQHDFEQGMLPIGTNYDDKFRWATIFKYSLRKDWFLLSIDIGEGLLQDASVIKIKKLCKTGPESFVLVTIGVFESDDVQIPDFAQVLVQLTKRLNLDQVRIVIERNTYGDLFMLNIENIEEKDPEGFEIPLECYAKFARKEGAKLEKGLRLNSANKKFGVAAWKQYMNSLENIETDTGCINQVREFGEDEKGNFKAAIGHDDLVMPEVNLSYYIKSDNQGWREFKQSFLDDSEIDEYNSNVLKSLKLNAVTRIKEEIDASKYQITQVDDKFNEYSIITTPKSEENIELFGAATKEERKKIIENSEDEYALAAKIYDKSKAKSNKRIVDYRNEFRKTKIEDNRIDYKDIVNML